MILHRTIREFKKAEKGIAAYRQVEKALAVPPVHFYQPHRKYRQRFGFLPISHFYLKKTVHPKLHPHMGIVN